MKLIKALSLVICVILLFHIVSPVAHAVDCCEVESMFTVGDFKAFGMEDNEKLYNIIINTVTGFGQFSVAYAEGKD